MAHTQTDRACGSRRLSVEGLEPRHLLAGDLAITEFMAVNTATLVDEDEDFSDWIELSNVGDMPLDVGGWHLTDDAAEPTRWTLPTKTLGPGEYLLVFASGKDRADSGGELHANFVLPASDGYVGLFRPDGTTLANQFGPGYRHQAADVSFGVAPQTAVSTLLSTGAIANVLVPAGPDDLPVVWNTPDFDDSSWPTLAGGTSGPTGVGFETRDGPASYPELILAAQPSRYYRFEEADTGGPAVDEIAAANGAFSGNVAVGQTSAFAALGNAARFDDTAGTFVELPMFHPGDTATVEAWVNFSSSGPSSGFAAIVARWDGSYELDVNIGTGRANFVTKNAANGFALAESGETFDRDQWHHVVGIFENGLTTVYVDAQQGTVADTSATGTTLQNAGSRLLIGATRNGDFRWNGFIDEVAIYDRALSADEIREHFEVASGITSTTIRNEIQTDIGSLMHGENATAAIRLPFFASEPATIDALTLYMKYDDGFVAYLNGAEVARDNAPAGAPTWNTAAPAQRSNIEAARFVEFGLTGFLDQLRVGQNVLAIHGLNRAPDDGDFLIAPELIATTTGVVDLSLPGLYQDTATPGDLNAAGSAGVRDVEGIVINEISARNRTVLDEDGDDSDWLELFNPHPYAVDLDDAYLTNDENDLTGWRFMRDSIIPPRGFLVVFASGKDRRQGELHTDFRLSGDGEYLALVEPDGETIASQFAPYPGQFPDVSYGIANDVAVTTLAETGSTVTVLVPGSATDIPVDWTQADFDDSSWDTLTNGATGPLPIGFGLPAVPAPGPDPITVDPDLSLSEGLALVETGHRLQYEADPNGGTPATAGLSNLALSANGSLGFSSSSLSPTSFGADRVNDGGYGQGSVGDDANPWIASSSDNSGFVGVRFPTPRTVNMIALGTRLPGRGDGTFAVQYTSDSFTAVDLNDRGQVDALTWTDIGTIESTEPDEWQRQLIGFQSVVNVTALRVSITEGGTAIAEMEAYEAPVGSLVATDIANEMFSQASTALVRIPFTVDQPNAVDRLLFDIQYDDAFVAYVNGVELTRANITGAVGFDSVADSAHSPNTIESFDLSAAASSLVAGPDANVLAIHGLNLAADDTDLFVSVRLQSLSINTSANVTRYFLAPSPGEANGLATEDRGPVIQQVNHGPNNVPTETENLVVTATVDQVGTSLGSVRLHYRVMYGAEPAVNMVDDGTGPDAIADDGIFTASIPSSSYNAGQMVRYYVTAEDLGANISRWPLQYDSEGQDQAAEYLGTVVYDPNVTSRLPRLQWYVPNPVPTADSTTVWESRASLFFDGEFYDNIFVRIRGASSRERAKKPFKFDFPEGRYFRYSDDAPRAEEINLNASFQDKSYIREPLAYETYRLAQVPSPDSFSVRVEVNGEFFSVASLSEQIDEIFLEQNGLDPEGAMYKMFNGITSASGGVEKKTRRDEGNGDLAELVAGLSTSNPDRKQYVFDNIDIPAAINYMVSGIMAQDFDRGAKNFYVYRDTNGTGEWTQFPFDQDLTFGNRFYSDAISGDGSAGHAVRSHPFYGESRHQLFGTNMMIDAIIDIPETREMYLRRLRTVMDQILQTADTPVADRYYEQRLDELEALLTADAAADLDKWGAIYGVVRGFPTAMNLIRTNYLDQRRVHLFETHSIDNVNNPQMPDIAGIPHAQIGNPQINFDPNDFDTDPSSGNQDQEYLRLNNPNDTAVEISGWQLRGGVEYTFKAGAVIPAGGALYVSPDVTQFRARTTGPSGGQGLFVQGNYRGHISNFGETIELVSADNTVIDTITTPPTPTDNQLFLRVSELHYNPDGPDDTEFIELTNTSSGPSATTLDLSGVSITGGPADPFLFPGGTTLGPSEFLLVVNDRTAFQAAYPTVDPTLIAGEFDGGLSNGGEEIKLEDAGGSTIVAFTYGDNDPWPTRADGDGASLELILAEETPATDMGKYYHWRASTEVGGSPGSAGIGTVGVVINEVMSHTEPPTTRPDAIELYNATTSSIDLSGWFLSDSAGNLLKYPIPDGTILEPGQYTVFDESHFNPHPDDPGPNNFALNGSHGDDVWLVAGDGSGGLATFVDDVHFGAAANGVTWGRHPNGSGRLAPMARQTLGCANLHSRVGSLVISEIHYHPESPSEAALAIDPNFDPNDLEFVEIYNPTGNDISLTDWRIRGGADFDFAADTTIAADETLIVVSFDPDSQLNSDRANAFRAHFGIDATIRLLGGFSGTLSNGFERIELQRPDVSPPDEPTFVPHVQEDEVLYDDRLPWPIDADGAGESLHRATPVSYGNDGARWHGSGPSPGSVSFAGSIPGDITGDGLVTATDIDVLFDAISASYTASFFDLDGGGTVDIGDVEFLVSNILGTVMADANLDGVVDGSDFNIWNDNKFAGCEKSWSQGDFSGDGVVDASDYNVWFMNRFSGIAAAHNQRANPATPDVRAGPMARAPLATDSADMTRRDWSLSILAADAAWWVPGPDTTLKPRMTPVDVRNTPMIGEDSRVHDEAVAHRSVRPWHTEKTNLPNELDRTAATAEQDLSNVANAIDDVFAKWRK